MNRKKILIVNPISLYPKVMACQDRMINMIKRLSQDHDIDLVSLIRNAKQCNETKNNLESYIKNFYFIKAINPSDNLFKRKIAGIQFLYFKYFQQITHDYFYTGHRKYIKQLIDIINNNKYDILQIEYWFQGAIFDKIDQKLIKVVDTQDLLYEKRSQYLYLKYNGILSKLQKKRLIKYEQLETSCYRKADILISITNHDNEKLTLLCPNVKNIIIASGQNIEYFSNFEIERDDKTILFYGSMGGQENIDAFFRFYNKILPLIKKQIDGIKVMVVGANPPESIKKLANDNLVVTGFVEDVRNFIGKSTVMIIPLNVAGGFRSRTVDVMAMGVPVVGTHNALDNIEIDNGKHGFISDNDIEMANFIIKIINDKELHSQMSKECKKFTSEKYSIETTFGKLSNYYKNL